MSDPGITFFATAGFPVLAIGISYLAGAVRRRNAKRPVSMLRHTAFAAGLALLLLSLQWPFAVWAHELFYVHQIGILIARIVAPMLLAMARPAGLIIAGIPRRLRARLVKPGLLARPTRRGWRVLSTPALVMICYVGSLYFWEIPDMQGDALANPTIGLLMHFSLLGAGLLFWTRLFEKRPVPHGIVHAQRLMMIWLAILSQIALGAYITVKTTVLYHAYDATQRAAVISPLSDEAFGGFFIWIASGLLSLIGLICVVDLWGRHETRQDAKRTRWSSSNSAILLYPSTGQRLREMARPKNRRLAIGLTAFVLLVFTAVCGIVAGAHRINRRDNLRSYQLSRSA
ncbi:cytochrome c oxidase assembly protein [Novosphingobium sp. G106]|uniref:cytochrome c oxidase assembly protein n=1 Tax=Novosphingobium sp. G106 TaxID=2849500 RepID=UPI001C2DBD6C|nr:cytochrome c oxidase assembly protein [Novosphingobium sp. G106]MBV1691360.1 cytochrome c oxidase assembly protein [Novosphingobium sp. G106]